MDVAATLSMGYVTTEGTPQPRRSRAGIAARRAPYRVQRPNYCPCPVCAECEQLELAATFGVTAEERIAALRFFVAIDDVHFGRAGFFTLMDCFD